MPDTDTDELLAPQTVQPAAEPAPATESGNHPFSLDLAALRAALIAQQYNEKTALRYAKETQAFLSWAASKGWSAETLPENGAEVFFAESAAAPESKRFTKAALQAGLDGLRRLGRPVPALSFPVIPGRTPPAQRVAPPATEPAAPATVDAPSPSLAPPEQSVQRVVKNQDVLKEVPGKLRISRKITDPMEGQPGSWARCGDEYNADDVATEGKIGNFIQRYIVPQYGPKPGGPNMVYLVEILNALGNVTSSYKMTFAAPMLGAPAPVLPPPPQAPPAAGGGMPQDMVRQLFDTSQQLLAGERERNDRAIAELRAQAEQKGQTLDPMLLMMLQRDSERSMERIKAEFDRAMAEIKVSAPPPALDFQPTAPPPDPMHEASARFMEKLAERALLPEKAERDPLLVRLLEERLTHKDEIPAGLALLLENQAKQIDAMNRQQQALL